MQKVNDTNNTMYLCKLPDESYTRFWFINEGIIEELLNEYEIPYKKVKPNEKYYWFSSTASKYWRERK